MQDRYAGDIGDFGKFLLLRYLFLSSKTKLCQIWYKYPNERHNNDGLYINYFEKIKNFDLFLENSFKNLIQKERSIKALEKLNLLPFIKYYSKEIKIDKESLEYRKAWFKEALSFSINSGFILLDADNGLATRLNKDKEVLELLKYESFFNKNKQGKYVFFDEIEGFYKKSSLIIYHHLNRTMSHDKQITLLKDKLKENFEDIIIVKHKQYSVRIYIFLLKNKTIKEELYKTLETFVTKFSPHFTIS